MSAEQAANIIATVSPDGMVERLVELTRENATLKAQLDQLEAELAQLRTTAKRRLELLRKCEWMGHVYAKVCPNCGHSKMDGHANDCNWAAELKEPR